MDPYRISGTRLEAPYRTPEPKPAPAVGFKVPPPRHVHAVVAAYFDEILQASWYEIEYIEFHTPNRDRSEFEIRFHREDHTFEAHIVVMTAHVFASCAGRVLAGPDAQIFFSDTGFECDRTTWARYRTTGRTRFGFEVDSFRASLGAPCDR